MKKENKLWRIIKVRTRAIWYNPCGTDSFFSVFCFLLPFEQWKNTIYVTLFLVILEYFQLIYPHHFIQISISKNDSQRVCTKSDHRATLHYLTTKRLLHHNSLHNLARLHSCLGWGSSLQKKNKKQMQDYAISF